jgi:hypothetical protein
MPDLSAIQPVAAIIGAVITATTAALVTYVLVVKRKSLGFWVTKTEDLTSSLRRHHQQIVVSVGGQGFLNLNRANVLIKNTGNTSIGDFKFDIQIPGEHHGYLSNVSVENNELREAITITSDQPARTLDPTLHVNVASFLNAGESFRISMFFDGTPDQCEVRCRIADVKSKVRTGEPLEFRDVFHSKELRALLISVAAVGMSAGILGSGFQKLYTYIQILFKSATP